MANPLSNYVGNAGLGVGGNADIPVVGDNNLNVINNTVRDIQLLDNQKNMQMFQQKIQDRDNLTNLLLQNQVPPGEIEPQYQKYYDEASKKVQDEFDSWKGNFNDTKGFQKYIGAVKDLQHVATHSRTNTEQLKQLQQQQAAETLPTKKKAIGDWIDRQKKQDFWNPVNPYQQMHDLNMDTFKGFVQDFTAQERDKTNPTVLNDTSYVDFDDILRKSRSAYINDLDKANDIQQLYDKFSAYDQPQLTKTLDAMDGQIDKYNQQRGFQEGQKGFVPHVNRAVVSGTTMIKEPMTDFAAKYALANQEKFATRTPKFDFKMMEALRKNADLGLKQKDLARKWFDSNTKRLMANLKSRSLDQADDATKQFSQVWDTIGGRVQLPESGNQAFNAGLGFKVDANTLPEGFQYTQGINEKGQPIRLIPKDAEEVLDNKKKVIGYKGGHYDVEYFVPKGATLAGKRKADKDYNLSQDDMYHMYERSGFKGTFKDFVQSKFNNKEIDYKLEGANGKADRVSSFISQMAAGNKATKKGQESPFSSNEEDLIQQDEPPDNTPPE